jgi:hypothetical protein
METKAIVCDTPESIQAFKMLAMKGALKLELLGMKRRGRSAFAMVKEHYGFKGSKQKVYDQYINLLKEKGVLV